MSEAPAAPARAAARGPLWPWAIIAVLALIEPATHVWIAVAPPAGTVASGAHTGDSAHHIVCMRAFATGFDSPFATCQSLVGHASPRLFATPFFFMYAVLGAVPAALGWDLFVTLGVLNGLGAALYLIGAYGFLREAAPKVARLAFVFFVFPAGLGGVLYLVTAALGWHGAPEFEAHFQRYAFYELLEGPHAAPTLLFARLYYTLPLALGLFGVTRALRAARLERATPLTALVLLALATVVNMRTGPMLWGVAACWFACDRGRPGGERLRRLVAVAAPVAAGVAASLLVMRWHPSYARNLVEAIRMAMWLSPFVSATLLLWVFVPCETWRALRSMSPALRVIAFGITGYLAAFGVLYAGYQAYYGNFWRCADVMVAVRMSDWALLGAPLGMGWAWARRPRELLADESAAPPWAALWFLAYLAVALSAFGQGWFMRFNPQRFMTMLGLPMAILAAHGVARLGQKRPRWAQAYTAAVCLCGTVSIGAASLCFQGPLGRTPGRGPFAYHHYSLWTRDDAAAVEAIPGGVVLTPPWAPISFADLVALRPGLRVVGGAGAMNIGGAPFVPLRDAVEAFFEPDTPGAARHEFVKRYCVDYIFWPGACHASVETRAQLRAAPWLRTYIEQGDAVVFEVVE